MIRDYQKWSNLKEDLNQSKKIIDFKEGQIWWANIGLNIGHEENGKGDLFLRPVAILRKFNKRLFFAIPLTTQVKDNIYYHKISFKGKTQCAMLSQIRVLECRRLRNRMGELSKYDLKDLRLVISKLLISGVVL